MSYPQPPFRLCPYCNSRTPSNARFCEQCREDLTQLQMPLQSMTVEELPRIDTNAPPSVDSASYARPQASGGRGWTSVFSYHGRASRQTFWLTLLAVNFGYLGVVLASGLISWCVMIVLQQIGIKDFRLINSFLQICQLGYSAGMLTLLWIALAVQIKRWHDLGMSGFMMLINIIPFGGCYTFIQTGFVEGTRGPNRFGADPLGRHSYLRRY